MLLPLALIAVNPVFYGIISVVLAAPAVPWLPQGGDARALLGILLGAQAAIAALTLAVMLFVLQASARRDADDRVYQAYIRESWAQFIFWGSIVAVGTTGIVLLTVDFGARGAPLFGSSPGLPNLIFVGPLAFFGNLILSLLVFERAIPLAGPDRWQAMRLQVFKSDIRATLRIERRRVVTVHDSQPIATEPFLGPAERPADLSIQALMDDARRAMDERRQGDFERALDTVIDLVEYALDEIERAGLPQGSLGSTPRWPPLRGLTEYLAAFAEDVIREGNRENVFGLLRLNYWLLSRGLSRRSGELFTLGVHSYRLNYEIAARIADDDLREMLRDRLWQIARLLVLDIDRELLPYARWMIRQQERLLSHALHADLVADYGPLHREFAGVLASLSRKWDIRSWRRPDPGAGEYRQLEQEYRIALMGLGGRAAILAPGRIQDAVPYLDVTRAEHRSLSQLADDLAQALSREERAGYSLWSDWEMEGAPSLEVRTIQPERYPLIFFAVRLLDLATPTAQGLDFRGRAQFVLDWFMNNADALGQHVRLAAGTSLAEQREFAIAALTAAVRRDEVEEQEEIIRRELSEDRIDRFKTSVYASVFTANTIERLFTEAAATQYLPVDAADGPELRGNRDFIAKGFLAAEPAGGHSHWAPLDGEGRGEGAEDDLVKRLCEELESSTVTTTSLESTEDLLGAIDVAVAELGSPESAIVLLSGDSHGIATDTGMGKLEGFEPWWELSDSLRGEVARYRGYPIIDGPSAGIRRLYVIEPGAWGCFLRAQVEGGTDLHVEVDSISAERAEELLVTDPNLFPDEPDEASKLRKIQTFVEVGVAARTGFHVADPSRARKIVGLPPPG